VDLSAVELRDGRKREGGKLSGGKLVKNSRGFNF
jgi:hypothetical protein